MAEKARGNQVETSARWERERESGRTGGANDGRAARITRALGEVGMLLGEAGERRSRREERGKSGREVKDRDEGQSGAVKSRLLLKTNNLPVEGAAAKATHNVMETFALRSHFLLPRHSLDSCFHSPWNWPILKFTQWENHSVISLSLKLLKCFFAHIRWCFR